MAAESSFKNMLIVLVVISAIASLSLGVVYKMTKESIAKVVLAKQTNAIRNVVPEFNNNPLEESYTVASDGDSLVFFPAKKDGNIVGIAIQTYSPKGFSGNVKVMVGFLPDGTIYRSLVVEHKETPGLGDKMDRTKSSFANQFDGKNPETYKISVKKDGGQVDAITASTISSRAYCDALNRAYKAFKSNIK